MNSVLTINSGSSSLRFALFADCESLPKVLSGKFDRIGLPNAKLSFKHASTSQNEERAIDAPDHVACVPLLVKLLAEKTGGRFISAIGLFTVNKPVIFAYHGYPWLIHRLTYRRTNHHNFHVRGFKEEGTTTTPFDMVVVNELDRFHLAADVIDRVPQLGVKAAYAKQAIRDKLIEHKQYIAKHGEDLPEIRNWKWNLTQ